MQSCKLTTFLREPTFPLFLKAAVFDRYGPPENVRIQEVEKPVPDDDQVLINIHASTITAGDCEMRRFDIPRWLWLPLRLYMGLVKPRFRIPGQECSGVIQEVGKNVTNLKVGDRVFAPTTARFGGHAEYICLSKDHQIVKCPDNIDLETAAAIPTGALNAIHFIEKAQIKKGDSILINGAGGSIGTIAIQLAKHLGAHITAVDHTSKLEMLTEIGADHTIDYTKDSFLDVDALYDAVIDIVGKGWMKGIRLLRPGGRYIVANPNTVSIFHALTRLFKSTRLINALAPYKIESLKYARQLIEDGAVRIVVDKTFDLDEIVEAHKYVESGMKKGNVIILI